MLTAVFHGTKLVMASIILTTDDGWLVLRRKRI